MKPGSSLVLSASALVLCLYLLSAIDAFSYIDPGSGSYVLQILIASILGILPLIKLYWSKVKTFFSTFLTKKPDNESSKG